MSVLFKKADLLRIEKSSHPDIFRPESTGSVGTDRSRYLIQLSGSLAKIIDPLTDGGVHGDFISHSPCLGYDTTSQIGNQIPMVVSLFFLAAANVADIIQIHTDRVQNLAAQVDFTFKESVEWILDVVRGSFQRI